MNIYKLTDSGWNVSRNTSAEASDGWRVIWALRSLKEATPDYIALESGLEEKNVRMALLRLKNKGLIEEK